MSKKLGALSLAGALFLVSAGAMADVAGAPAGGGGSGGGTSSGGGTTTSSKSGGCSAATPGGAQTSAALLVGLGLLVAIPAMRRRRARKGEAPRG